MKISFDTRPSAVQSFVEHTLRSVGGSAFLMLGILLFVAAPSLIAAGTIKGKVFDKDSKDALPGADTLS